MRRIRFICTCLLLVMPAFLTGCRAPWEDSANEEPVDGYMYYLDHDRDDLDAEGYSFDGKDGQSLADEITRRLTANSESEDISPLPAGVVIESTDISNNCLNVHFNSLFSQVEDQDKVLCLAALVRSYIQIPQVNAVSFFIGEQPLTDDREGVYEEMKAEDFFCPSPALPSVASQKVLTLYYGKESGEYLAKEQVPVMPSEDQSLIRTIMQRLIEGPAYEGEIRTVPDDTKIINISVMNETAYINLSADFSDGAMTVSPKVAVYSIVNSIIDNTEIKKVQILVDGAAMDSYGGQIDLRFPLEADRSIIK